MNSCLLTTLKNTQNENSISQNVDKISDFL